MYLYIHTTIAIEMKIIQRMLQIKSQRNMNMYSGCQYKLHGVCMLYISDYSMYIG
jgi:hypothetical protein